MERDPGAGPTTVDEAPSEEELAIVRLLAKGLTDEVIAQRLGISKRTYGRRFKVVMRKLGARSRFEAGARAVLSGWLEGDPPLNA